MIRRHSLFALLGLLVLTLNSCGNSDQHGTENQDTSSTSLIQNQFPDISGDSAFVWIQKQLAFGYRVPGTPSHQKCADWLFSVLKQYCDTVYYQKGTAITYDKKTIPVYNIIGAFNPAKKQRAMLSSHWDSRPWGDEDNEGADKPIEAANDGASGVALLIELAKQMKQKRPAYGVDIVLFDAEDYGKGDYENSFCLGSQYWGKHPHVAGYRAAFGVLLDMVGGKDAQFFQEENSMQTAGWVVDHMWKLASEMGYSNTFQQSPIGPITDDHRYVNAALHIPMVDVIQFDSRTHRFAGYWHTHKDNLDAVDKKTLAIVGRTVSALVFNPPITIVKD